MNVASLVSFSLLARWFALIAAVIGFLLASLSFFNAHRTVEAASTDAERLVLARSQRSSEALSVAAQLAFMFVGLSFVSFPPAPPSSAAQIGPYFDGILRTAGFAFGAAVLALKSFLGMQIETQLAAPRRQREAMHLADLEMANRSLEAATRAKSDFLASMSHELRTPLNAVLGFSGLLTEQLGGTLADQQNRFLSNIREAGEHLLELINEVLDLSKVEAGRMELHLEETRLAPLIEPVAESTRTSADTAGVTFEVEGQSDGAVRLDPQRFRQILYNLLSNAVKFTPRGGSVRLRLGFAGDDLVVEVIDTGLGIPKAQHGRVFGTFERLHEGRSTATGTGLGLALTKSLVELHGGSISFESEEDRGTTFRVVLPAVRHEAVGGDRLLVVDDDRADAELIVALAAEAHLRSEVVVTARAAIEAARHDPPRGIVLDLRLPDGRGEQVLEALKADARTRDIPVIVVTVEDDEGRSRPLGAIDHFTKPIDRTRIAAWLRTLTPLSAR
ncbi:MAG TPA: ATP-binding protein [Candidatus Limnocylindria bacterium]